MPATIFSGSKVKTLKGTLNLNGGADVISSTTNPQASAVDALKGSLLLNTTSGILYRKLDDGSSTNWEQVGSGAGTKNYIVNPDFDGGSTTGWNMKKVSLSSLVPTGNILAADAGHTIATSSSSPLEGTNSLLVQGASLFTAGNCLVSDAFAIDREDQAKVLGWSFAYEAVTTNMDFPGTSAGTWAVYIAETTTATPDTIVSWIQPAGVYNLVQGTGVGIASGTFQTTASGTAYRLVLVCINSEAAATTLKVDDFKLGPQQTVLAPAMSDWQSYTATLSAGLTNATQALEYRRVGDSIEVRGKITVGSSDVTGNISFSLPSGLSFRSGITDSDSFFGTATAAVAASPYFPLGTLYKASSTTLGILTDGANAVWNASNPVNWVPGDYFNVNSIAIPVSGWSSNTVSSADTDTRVVAARLTKSAGQSIPNNSVTKLTFNTVSFDSHASWSTSSNDYVVPVSGRYRVSAVLGLDSTWAAAANQADIQLYKNGASFATIDIKQTNAAGTFLVGLSGGTLVDCLAGDLLSFYCFQNSTNTATTRSTTQAHVSIERLSGPAVVQATETVATRYSTAAGQSISSGGSPAIVDFGTQTFDTHGATTTGASWKFTAPISGLYKVSSSITFVVSASGNRSLFLYKNGSQISRLDNETADGSGLGSQVGGEDLIQLNAGEYIDVRAYQDSGGPISLVSDVTRNYVSIVRL